MGMLLQTTCIIINPVLNVATKNVENDVLKKLKEKDKDDEKTSVEKWFKINSLNKVIDHIKQMVNKNSGHIFELKQLENTYIETLKSQGYFIESHVSRFGDMLKEKLPGIEL